MQLTYLSSGALLSLTDALLDKHSRLLQDTPATAWYMPELKAKAADLKAATTSTAGAVADPQLTARIRRWDERHDESFTALLHALRMMICLARASEPAQEDEAQAWDAILRVLAPDGAWQTKKTFLDEAGDAPRYAAALSDGMKRRLAALTLGSTTGLALVEQWVKVATELGDLVSGRSAVQGVGEVATNGQEARAAMISALGKLFDLIGLSSLTPEQKAAMLTPFDEAVIARR